MIYKIRQRVSTICALAIATIVLASCAAKPAKVAPAVETNTVKNSEESASVSFSEQALKITVPESQAARPSWTYYQYALQAMDNQEWLLARHYLDESLRQLVAEKYDSTYILTKEDSIYRADMPKRIVEALDEVYPNVAELGENADNFVRNDVSIEGIDDLDENQADSASLMVIESFLDTLDPAQFTLPIVFNDRVQQEIFYMTNQARSFMAGSLNRKTAYDSLIYAKLDEAQMPRDLIFLSLVESGFKVKAYSRAKASGMWQFIPETGKRYGLELDYWVDMRRNPEKATEAALKYLKRLHDEFGDWLLAMAAYNCGEGRVRRLVKEMKADSTRDSTQAVTYWDLELPKETMRYVPRILAAMVIGHYPEQYDMVIEKQTRAEFDTVTVFDSFPLEEVAKLLKVKEDTLRSLNMELVKWCTPPNKDSYLLRLPVGTRAAFVEGYDKMEKNNFSSWLHHKVKRGENLGVIARQYGIKVSELQQANDMKNTRIRAGQSLLIPIRITPKKKTAATANRKPEKIRTYIAKPEDNLASIARKFGISQENLRAWNDMDMTSFVSAGDTIFVSKPEPKANPKSEMPKAIERPILAKGEKYVAKSGDTYGAIAKAYNVPVVLLLQANNGFKKRLAVGDSIIIPEFKQVPSKAKAQTKAAAKPKAEKKKTSEKTTTYTVRAGDNLTAISRKYNTTVARIQELNDMGENTVIDVGQKLKVPAIQKEVQPTDASEDRTHEVQKGESLWDIARQYKVTIEDIVKWNNLNDTKVKAGEKLKIKK